LFYSKNETLKMGELIRKNIFKRFNIDTIIAKNIQYYNKILS
jgi:hypothetical protein